MKPISRKWLPQTITLFNFHKDPDSGKINYYRTIIEAARVDEVKTSLGESLRGVTKHHKTVILLDRRTSKGYVISEETGRRQDKPYLPWSEWESLAADDKKCSWSLNQQQLLAVPDNGQKITVTPEFNRDVEPWQDFISRHGLRPIADIDPNIDKDGSIHSWKVTLA